MYYCVVVRHSGMTKHNATESKCELRCEEIPYAMLNEGEPFTCQGTASEGALSIRKP